MSDLVGILGVGTAAAPFLTDQAQVSRLYGAALEKHGADAVTLRRAKSLFRLSGTETRQFVLPDFADPQRALLYVDQQFPSTGARMSAFGRHAPAFAEAACRRAIGMAGVAAERISHLVVATCTGVGAPDLDVELVSRLRLSATTRRTMVVWMSCTGAFPALRAARRAVEASTGSLALVVCVELCSLHARRDPEPGSLLAHALFADGAGAVVVGSGFEPSDYVATLGDERTELLLEGRELLKWDFSDDGFRAHLDLSLPDLIEEHVADFVASATRGEQDEVASWCVHPGGMAILDGVQRALKLPDDCLTSARQVLRTLGNMSSSTLLYVLERELLRTRPGAAGLMLGFGTGITMEALRFTRSMKVVQTGRPPSP